MILDCSLFPGYVYLYSIQICYVCNGRLELKVCKGLFFFTCNWNKTLEWNYPISHKTAYMDRVKRIWYLSPMRAAKVQASLRIRAVSPEPPLLAQTSSESRGTLSQKARSLAPLNGGVCAVKICHDGVLEDTNSLDGAHMSFDIIVSLF